jgi:hypothetical protein
MMLWRFVGKTNVILSNGANWQRHSRVVKSALDRNVPVADFVTLARRLFKVMGDGGQFVWDDLTMVRTPRPSRPALDLIVVPALHTGRRRKHDVRPRLQRHRRSQQPVC